MLSRLSSRINTSITKRWHSYVYPKPKIVPNIPNTPVTPNNSSGYVSNLLFLTGILLYPIGVHSVFQICTFDEEEYEKRCDTLIDRTKLQLKDETYLPPFYTSSPSLPDDFTAEEITIILNNLHTMNTRLRNESYVMTYNGWINRARTLLSITDRRLDLVKRKEELEDVLDATKGLYNEFRT